jgi:hypothetical protein
VNHCAQLFRIGGILAVGVLLLLGVTTSSIAASSTEPPQILRHTGLDPFNPGVPAPDSVWYAVFPGNDEHMPQQGYVDVNANGIIAAQDQIRLRGFWFPILTTTPVLTMQLPVVCHCPPDHFLAIGESFPLENLAGTQWQHIAPGVDPALWPLYIVESWVDHDSDGSLSPYDDLVFAGLHGDHPLFALGVHLGISIPGEPTIPIESSSWGAVKSLFSE